jgi:hypothetical protein
MINFLRLIANITAIISVFVISNVLGAEQEQPENAQQKKSYMLTIEYKLENFYPDDEELDDRYDLEELLNEFLRDSKLGYCSDVGAGGGIMMVSCVVYDYEKAEAAIIQKLQGTQFSNYSKMYNEGALED